MVDVRHECPTHAECSAMSRGHHHAGMVTTHLTHSKF